MTHIAIIGFGEAGQIYAEGLARKATIRVWDKKLMSSEAASLRARAQQLNVGLATSLGEAIQDADLILSLVTAGNAREVAEQAAPLLVSGQHFLDFNSVSPATKQAAAEAVKHGKGSYLDVAVMAPVPPKRLATPLLLAGPHADLLAETLTSLDCRARAVSDRIGDVSAIKMCRSVMIKGLEALTTECLSAAQQYGVEDAVLASLHASFPSMGWNDQLPHYLISRVAEHGVRRAEEMGEVVKTLQDAGVDAMMSKAIRQVQAALPAKMAERGILYSDLQPFVWQTLLNTLK